MNNSSLTLRACSCLVASIVIGASAAQAQDRDRNLTFSMRAGGSYSDNIGRVSDGEASDTALEAGMSLGLLKNTTRLTTRVGANLQYRTYTQDSFGDELLGGFNGDLRYWFSPDRFGWMVQDNFGQTFIDPRAVENPDNRQSTNYFTTGPDLRFQIGDRNELALMGRFSSATFESTGADNTRLGGTVAFVRRLSRRMSLSLNGSTERVEYDDAIVLSEFDRRAIYLGLEAQGAHTTLSVEGGYSEVEVFDDPTGRPFFSLVASRELTARTSLTLNAGSHLTDSAESFRLDQRIGGLVLENEDTVVTQDPFRSDYASLSWTLEGSRGSFGLTGEWQQDVHEIQTEFDRTTVGAGINASRRLGPVLGMSLSARWRSEDFGESNLEFDEWLAGIGFDWSFARNLGLALRADRVEGSGDTSGGGVRDFTENRVSLAVTFTPRN